MSTTSGRAASLSGGTPAMPCCVSAILLVTVLGTAALAARPLDADSHTIRTSENQDALEKVAKLVLPHGYPLQVHSVTTEDGFLLTLLRIPHGLATMSDATGTNLFKQTTDPITRSSTQPHDSTHAAHTAADSNTGHAAGRGITHGGGGKRTSPGDGLALRRPVVFLQHGLLDSAAGYLVNGPGKSLGFILADLGFDVWLGNVRGNSLSRSHKWLTPDDPRFWEWSYDEMAKYDMPAMWSYVLAAAGVPSLSYVGHSQGTTVLLAALSSQPELCGRLDRAVLLAPVAVAKHISSVPLLAMAALGTERLFQLLGIYEFLPSQELVAMLEGHLCRVQPYLCVSFLAALCGYNADNLDNARLPLYLTFAPAGTSVQNMAHWAQAVRSRAPNTMSYFDYGTNCATSDVPGRCNQLQYDSPYPPLYNLTAITTPFAIYSGTQDRLAAPLDVEFLLESLSPGVVRRNLIIPTYEHLDFIWGIDAVDMLYEDIIRFLQQDVP